MRRLLAVAVALPLAACWGPPGYLSFSGDPPGPDEIWVGDTDDRDSDEPYSDGVSPVVESADAWCYPVDDAGQWWGFKATTDDPQGTETIESYNEEGVVVLDGGGQTVAAIALVCEGDGQCWGSAQAEHIEVACGVADVHRFVFQVRDVQGHRSNSESVVGRMGTGPTG